MTHADIPQPSRHWFMRIGLPLALLMAVAAVLIVAAWSSLVPARDVHTATALLREVETDVVADTPLDEASVILAPGWVEPEPWATWVGALASGVVQEILVLEGDAVTAGQPVATLIADDADIALRSAAALVEARFAALADAQASAAVIPAQVDAARAALHGLQDEYERKEQLVKSGAAAAGPVERLRLRIEAAHAELARLAATEAVAEAAVQSARASLAQAQAQRDQAALTRERMTVRAPIDGVVIELLASPGSVLHFGHSEPTSQVALLYEPSKLQVRADIPLADAAAVGAGQPARITVDLLPDTEFTGEVLRFVHRADLQKNTVEAKVRIDNPSPLLKPDMLARVRILPTPVEGETSRQRLPRVLVPGDAVIDGSVWIVDSDGGDLGVAARRTVQTGPGIWDDWIEVIEGIRPGERVIVDPSGLAEGDRVRAVDAGGAS